MSLRPIIERRRHNIQTRDYKDKSEPFKFYLETYAPITEQLLTSEDIDDQYLLKLIDYLVYLLPYDKITVIDNESHLASSIDLFYWGERHHEALISLKTLHDAKPDEGNIDTAINTNKGIKDRIGFLEDRLRLPISNPDVDSNTY